MARALSVDLRDRVVAAIAGGLSRRRAAARFGASAGSAVCWQQVLLGMGRQSQSSRAAIDGRQGSKPMPI